MREMDDGAGAVSSGFRRALDMEAGKNKIHTAAAVLSRQRLCVPGWSS